MVDSDGDGQVSFEEFHRLVIDPDPSRADFGIEPIKTDAQEAAQVTQASAAGYRVPCGARHTLFACVSDLLPSVECVSRKIFFFRLAACVHLELWSTGANGQTDALASLEVFRWGVTLAPSGFDGYNSSAIQLGVVAVW